MEPDKLIDTMRILEKLKNMTRHSWTSAGRRESVAEHSWRLAVLAYFTRDEFPEIDMDKVVLMCLVHDLGEAFTGDIPSFEKTEEDEVIEDEAVGAFLAKLPEPYKGELTALFEEMNALETPEGKLFKALDKLEAVMQHNEADISTWLPLEYELQLSYGGREAGFSEYTRRLKKALNDDSILKIEKEKNRYD